MALTFPKFLTGWTRKRLPEHTRGRIARSPESLEGRCLPTVFLVTSLADDDAPSDSALTLRQAIEAANSDTSVNGSPAGHGADIIRFDPFLAGGTINLSQIANLAQGPSALLITSDITIEGPAASGGITISRDLDVDNLRLFEVAAGAALTLKSLTLSEGFAVQQAADSDGIGGAVLNDGTLTIVQSTFYGNSASGLGEFGQDAGTGFGGAVYNNGGIVTIVNSTFVENSVTTGAEEFDALGGAIYNLNGWLSVYNSTFSGNSASAGSSIYVLADGDTATVVLTSSILANSFFGNDFTATDLNGGTALTSGTANLIQTASGFSGTIVSSADPDLAPLADNGGPTQTMALEDDSPAIGLGSNPLSLVTDQRGLGYPRTQGIRTDIGAYESLDNVIPIATLTSAPDVTHDSDFSQYEFSVTFADNIAINVATLGNGNMRVTGPNGYSQLATFQSVDVDSNGTPRVATYILTSGQLPDGGWNEGNGGTYYIELVAHQVADTSGNYATGGTLGSFRVDTALVGAPIITGILVDTGFSNTDGITNFPNQVFRGTAPPDSTVTISLEGTGIIGSVIATDTGFWQLSYANTTLPEGTYVFTATATDSLSNDSAPSAPFTVTIDQTAPPPPVITDPASATVVGSSTYTISGTTEDGAFIRIYADLNHNGQVDPSDPVAGTEQLGLGETQFAISVALAPQSLNDFLAKATDRAGNTSGVAEVPPITTVQPPVIALSSGSASGKSGKTIVVDSGAQVTDPDAPNFGGGSLIVSISAGGRPGDVLAVKSSGSGAGKLRVSNGRVLLGSTLIGTVSGGKNGIPLAFQFNAHATADIVQRLVQHITFKSGKFQQATTRVIEFVATDSNGVASLPALKLLNLI